MFLKRLFGHTSATETIDDDQGHLAETARNAERPTDRRDACRRLVALDTLQQIAERDTDAGVRELASARFRRLLCGLDPLAPPLEERLAQIAGVEDMPLLNHVATDAVEPALRRAALARVQSQSVLATCAVHDGLASNRVFAAERVEDKSALERLIKQIGKRDKNVYRIARLKLKHIAEQEERPRQVRAQSASLCEKLERLGRFEQWIQDRAVLSLIDQQWTEIEAEVEPSDRARFVQLRTTFLAGYDAYARENAAQLAEQRAHEAAGEEKRRLIAHLEAATSLSATVDIDQLLAETEAAWRAAGTAGESADARLQQAYAAGVAALGERRRTIAAEARRGEACERLQADAQKTLDAGTIDRAALKELKRRLERLGHDHAEAAGPREAIEHIETRLRKQQAQITRKLATLPERLAELDHHFVQGELKKAEPLYQSIVATLEHARAAGLPARDLAPTENHLKRIAPQLLELQRWRRWSADQHREDLCAEVETLIDDERPLESIAGRLQAVQDAWRDLDRGGAPARDALWQRFHAAAERVHERCRPFLDELAARREANREARESLCRKLEEFLDKVDWERVDWKKAARAEREMRQAWAAIGPVDGRHHRPLEGRFRKDLRRLDKILAEERARNQQLKRDLIRQMQALAEQPDLDRAIDAAKALQQQWHTTVPAHQRDENALWRTFRGASDTLFARRVAKHEARQAELTENLAERERICQQALDLANEARDAELLQHELKRLQTLWRDTEALPLPRSAVSTLNRRWNEAHAAVLARHEMLHDTRHWEALTQLADQSRFLDQTAHQIVDGAASLTPESLRQAWSALPRQDDTVLQQRLDGIFSLLLTALEDAAQREALAQRMHDGQTRRETLCLHLEITARLESPPELRTRRLELQVARLKERMGEGEDDPLAGATRLLQDWYLCAPATASSALAERFARVYRALRHPRPETAPA